MKITAKNIMPSTLFMPTPSPFIASTDLPADSKHCHDARHDQQHYRQWRDEKLAAYPLNPANLFTDIINPCAPDKSAIDKLKQTAQQHNIALYRFISDSTIGKTQVHALAQHIGLQHIHTNLCADADSLTSLQVTSHKGQHDYIPYTDKKLSWHTDGYYHTPEEQIHGMLLHCAQPAQEGGESQVMDHEIAYILLYEENPDYIHALMHPEAFSIPANILNDEVIRAESRGPVFSTTPDGKLHMRYSARQRNVEWRDDPFTKEAAAFLLDLWQSNSPYKIRYTLQANEGLLCNNILHCRSAFRDSDDPTKKRLLYRGRYTDRITDTEYSHKDNTTIMRHLCARM